jgi:iron complex transport system ATP-binding protein
MILQAQKLTVKIGGKTICRDLSFEVRSGECWGVLGQNGAGKTTLLRTLAGLHAPVSGTVRYDGRLLADYARRDLAQRLGVLLQHEGGEFWGSVQDYVLLGRFPYRSGLFGYGAQDEEIARQVLAEVELAELAQRPFNTLSGGECQRVAVAQLLAQQASCCLLDEPLQHLDLRHQTQVMRLFMQQREQDQALVMVLHDMLWAQRCCDRVLLMFQDGTVLHGAAQDLLTRANLEALYQCRLRELDVGGERCLVPGV